MHNETLKETGNRVAPRRRATSRNVTLIRQQLTPAEQTLVGHFEHTKLLSGAQLRRLSNASTPSAWRQLRRQLQHLSGLQVLARLDRRIGGAMSGSDGYIYALDSIGQRLLDPTPKRQWRKPWTPTLRLLEHSLAGAELYTSLVQAERAQAIDELVAFDSEPRCWRTFTGPGGGRLTLKPDAHLIVGHGDTEHHCWIEVDRSTESLPWIVTKARAYGRYYRSGREQTVTGVFPLCLWLVPDQRRAEAVTQALAELPIDDRPLHRVTVFDNAIATLINQRQQEGERV